MSDLIPFIIICVFPDNKSISTVYGKIARNLLESHMINEISEFVFDRNSEVATIEELHLFWTEFYDNTHYMNINPWEATAFIDGDWQSILLDDEMILKKLEELRTLYV